MEFLPIFFLIALSIVYIVGHEKGYKKGYDKGVRDSKIEESFNRLKNLGRFIDSMKK